MTSDANAACADMILADAICDLALRTGRLEAEVRAQIIESGAYDALYDEDAGPWTDGPRRVHPLLRATAAKESDSLKQQAIGHRSCHGLTFPHP